MTSARYQFAKYLQSFVTGCSSNLWEISKISSNDQLSSIEPNSSSNTKVPQICLSSRATWLSAMIALAPIGRVGRLPGSKHLEPDCVRQQTRRSWDLVLVIFMLVQDCKPLAILSCHGDPWRWWVAWSADCCADAGQGGQCWYLCIVHCLIHNIVAGCAVGPPGDKTEAQKGYICLGTPAFGRAILQYREGPPSKIRWWEAPFWVSSFFLRLTTSVYSRSSCNK